MVPAKTIQKWAEYLTPVDLGLAVIVVAAVFGLVCGLLRARRAVPATLPLLAYVVALCAAIREWSALPAAGRGLLVLLIGVAALAHARIAARQRAAETGESPPPGPMLSGIEDPFRPPPAEPPPTRPPHRPPFARGARAVLAVLGILLVVLLLDDLDGYARTLLAWESSVVQHGFAKLIEDGTSVAEFARRCLLWDDGVLSAGQTAMLYGPPTLAILHHAATPATLRLASVVAALLSVFVVFRFCRRGYGRTVALGATVFVGLNTPLLFYGRYGSSLAATLLAVLLAFWATWEFLREGRWTLLRALLCAAALFVATLHYAPARLAVLFLLAWIPVVVLLNRRLGWAHWAGIALIAGLAWGAWAFEQENGRSHLFLHARGEQVFGLIRNPQTIPALVGTDRTFSRFSMDTSQKLEILEMLVRKTSAELVRFMAPVARPRSNGAIVRWDPPPMQLYYAPVAVFAILGLVCSLRDWRRWQSVAPFLFASSYCAVLLLTNRVDAHRGFLLLIPVAIWVGIGVREVAWAANRLRVPAVVLTFAALALMVGAVFNDVVVRYRTHYQLSEVDRALAAELQSIPGPARFWMPRDHRSLSWLNLVALDKAVRGNQKPGGLLHQDVTNGLRRDRGGPRRVAVREAARMARSTTLLLGPRANFQGAVREFQRRGLRVVERDARGFDYYRIDGGARLTGIPDSELPPMSPIPQRPTPPPVRLSKGPMVYLSDLEPESVEFGFAAPKMDATWQGGPIVMAGKTYERGIGTHAWTNIRFRVPEGALYLQAIVGMSDAVSACEKASVEFEVLGTSDGRLWKSDVVDFATPPRAMQIPVGNQTELTLVTTEASDGRDCDHANWGSAAFVMRRPADQAVAAPAESAEPALHRRGPSR